MSHCLAESVGLLRGCVRQNAEFFVVKLFNQVLENVATRMVSNGLLHIIVTAVSKTGGCRSV